MIISTSSTSRRAKFFDRWATRLITTGGILIILAVLAIMAAIVWEAAPLFFSATAKIERKIELPADFPEQNLMALAVDSDLAGANFFSGMIFNDGTTWLIKSGSVERSVKIEPPAPTAKKIINTEKNGNRFTLLWDDNSVSLVEIRADESNGTADYRFVVLATDIFAAAAADGKTLTAIPESFSAVTTQSDNPENYSTEGLSSTSAIFAMWRGDSGEYSLVRIFSDGQVREKRGLVPRGIMAKKSGGESVSRETNIPYETKISTAALSADGSQLFFGTATGEIIGAVLPADNAEKISFAITPVFREGVRITALNLLVGGSSLALGSADGGFAVWQLRRENGYWRLRSLAEWGNQKIAAVVSGERNRTVFALTENGEISAHFSTTGANLFTRKNTDQAKQLAVNPRGDTLASLSAERQLIFWKIENPYPEAGIAGFFRKLWYENYSQPESIWQSTGTAESEPKLSLWPLLLGTLKGTFYALIFALPLALLSAVYVSQFAAKEWRGRIKPVVEMMAAVPSVVVGFLAALWFAPLLEKHLLALPVALLLLPLCFLIFLEIWRHNRETTLGKRCENGYEFIMAAVPLLGALGLTLYLSPVIEQRFFNGDFHLAILNFIAAHTDGTSFHYDQRNSIIIAFALGFAVIPTIFSLAEDALTSVPPALSAASLALGASRWQTVQKVILPSASPGIFAAIMIGIGRAVGETMIVLMATGNTPVMNFNPFDGMRTLAANIAVEIPEAPVGGTLYRTLFLCAVLLFTQTFILNTAAELVRHRLRKRFGRF